MLEGVTGKVPFVGDSTVATLSNRMNKLLPVSADLGPLAAVLERAGRPDPEGRSSVPEFGQALVRAAERLPRPAPIPVLGAGLFDLDEAEATRRLARPGPVVRTPRRSREPVVEPDGGGVRPTTAVATAAAGRRRAGRRDRASRTRLRMRPRTWPMGPRPSAHEPFAAAEWPGGRRCAPARRARSPRRPSRRAELDPTVAAAMIDPPEPLEPTEAIPVVVPPEPTRLMPSTSPCAAPAAPGPVRRAAARWRASAAQPVVVVDPADPRARRRRWRARPGTSPAPSRTPCPELAGKSEGQP